MKELFKNSETRICKAVFPETLNANNSLFGGKAMQWMDEAAYISATRFTRQRMFTAYTSKIKFLKAVEPNTIIEVVACVTKADAVRLTVNVKVYVENLYDAQRQVAIESDFIMVSLNDNNKAQRINYQAISEIECQDN